MAGAAIGGLSGALIGNSLDEINARNQALIAGQLGRAPAPGAVTNGEVIAMSQAGVSDDLIITHIRAGGAVASPTSQQLVELSSAGVSDSVIAALQTPVQPVAIVPVEPLPPPPVVLSSRFHPLPPYRCAPRRRFYGPPFPPAPGLSFGVSYSN